MFDDMRANHDQIVQDAVNAVSKVNRETVANAFVLSLSSRRLDIRSALGSYAVLQHFPVHSAPSSIRICPICRTINEEQTEELNVLNLERFKFGGVRHDNPIYASLDLDLFSRLRIDVPTNGDVALLKVMLAAIKNAPSNVAAEQLEGLLPKDLKSNKNERHVLIGILGLCGILETKDHHGYFREYVPYEKRELPDRRFVDMAYPSCWWSSRDGINDEAVNYWFGHLLARE